MATMSLTATSGTVTATISGMDGEHEDTRLFRWKFNGVSKGTSTSEPHATTHTNTFDPILCGTTYTVECEICKADGSEVFTTLTGTVTTPYATLPLWDWWSSNGTATAAQTQASYNALIYRQSTNTFHHKVWNDLAQHVVDLAEKSGLGWNSTYRAKDAVYLTADDYFYAKTANAIVQNIKDYPYFPWEKDRLYRGYIGRRYFVGAEDYDTVARADAVFGDYLIQMAKGYNVLAKIYSDSSYLRKLGLNEHIYLEFYADAPLVDLPARHLSDTEILETLSIPERELRDPASRPMSYAENMALTIPRKRLVTVPTYEIEAAHTFDDLSVLVAAIVALQPKTASGAASVFIDALTQMQLCPSARLIGSEALTIGAASQVSISLRRSAFGIGAETITALASADAKTARMATGAAAETIITFGSAKAVGAEYAAGTAEETVTGAGTAKTVRPEYAAGNTTEAVISVGTPKTVMPEYAAGQSGITVSSVGTAASMLPEKALGMCDIVILGTGYPEKTGAASMSASMTEALTHETDMDYWEMPLRLTGGLLIRQVHSAELTDGVLQIDFT